MKSEYHAKSYSQIFNEILNEIQRVKDARSSELFLKLHSWIKMSRSQTRQQQTVQ